MAKQRDYITDAEAKKLLPSYGGVTVEVDGVLYNREEGGYWWRADAWKSLRHKADQTKTDIKKVVKQATP